MTSPFANRLAKNAKQRRKWATRADVDAYRVYDRDMPEYPVAVDVYADNAHVGEYPRRSDVRQGTGERRHEIQAAIASELGVPLTRQHWKTHLPAGLREGQYERLAQQGERIGVREQGLRFWVNLTDFLDTGLFLDHRNTRARVRDEASGKRVLNLYSYTGSFSVYAAAGGAKSTTSVDLSSAYLNWMADNLALNGLEGTQHARVRADAASYLADAPSGSFDIVVLDPPSFSTSRDMRGTLDIQRDHPRLIEAALRVLAPQGVLYFSTNRFGFELRTGRLAAQVEELTPRSIPDDFTRKDSHRCWRISASASR